ncbi:vWA domain-containing protein [Chondromyces apiculatus]|uniref:Putative membrane protein n=1 Tax=Chondromyces apiculatus DSM 436 TaxID=1192034 RepID=A0A017T6U7_9BACT|nr:VWA domain-containing protein [Chondromyces apiculatus]EYF04505.1 Putative membrane protein precursor [Chondromyces apiculatus DSM 436]
MRTMIQKMTFVLGLAALPLTGCSSSEADLAGAEYAGPNTPGSTGVSQGGAQDFGLFRQILEDGGIPGPSTLDDLGFFAEHKLDYPTPSCGGDVCMHGLLGVMGNMISGSTCTLIQIGLNSPIDVATLERPPLHVVLAVDVSGSMAGAPMTYLKAGLTEMVPVLRPTDKVSLVTYSSQAKVVLDYVNASEAELLLAEFDALTPAGNTNLYDGLFTALSVAETHRDPAYQNRVLFMSDGVATTGIEDPGRLRSLAEAYARLGVGITSIGVGTEFDVDVMRDLSEVGAGNFYFLEDPRAVEEVFADEVQTFLVPVALDAQLDVTVGGGYTIRGVYGTNGWQATEGGGEISIPSLFLAGRESSDEPISEGRRGGGGAILLELVPRANQSGVTDPHAVGSLSLAYTNPLTGTLVTQEAEITAPNTPDAPPSEGYFSDKTVEKGFVMLNLYAGFKLAAELAYDSDPRTARRTLEALRPNVAAWLETTPDPDVEDDLRYVDMFIQNLIQVESTTVPYEPAEPPDPWPAD